jgi:hypothetical protein
LHLSSVGLVLLLANGQKNAAQVHSQGPWVKACIHEEAGHRMRRDGLPVDGSDQHALMTAGVHPLLAARAKKMRQPRRDLRPLRFLGWQEDQQVGVAAP